MSKGKSSSVSKRKATSSKPCNHQGTMGAKMITDRRFLFRPPISVKITGILQKTPEFQKMAIMISLSELILVFLAWTRGQEGYERREKERRRGGLRCDMLSCAVLFCAENTFIISHLLFEGCDLRQCFFLLHVDVSSTSFAYTDTDTDTCT